MTIHQIIIGHMLGDGHMAKVIKGNSYFTIHRKAEHHEYNLWTKNHLLKNGLLVSNTYPQIKQSGGSHSFPSSYFRTSRNKFWSEQRSLWYKNGKKVLPREYVKKHFNKISFLLWFLDDGDCYGRLSTDSFSMRDVTFLRDIIRQKYGIDFHIGHQFNRPQHPILRCHKDKMKDLLTIFQTLNISVGCMSYKLNLGQH